ncbi:unnamed protein product [Urochloa decumbens]|uniref:RRM domain-containing protein n=1 Tax=Urochloa decumbens TaxID=240449 RepID=A0ABC8VTP5_9POAL
MAATIMASTASAPWADLPPELLADISGRLHAASDNVRFHAVCWAWRESGDQPSYALPWLLAPSSAADDSAEDQLCRCVFSKATYRAPGICVRDRRVARADGTAAWLVSGKEGIFLVNPLAAEKLTLVPLTAAAPPPITAAMSSASTWPTATSSARSRSHCAMAATLIGPLQCEQHCRPEEPTGKVRRCSYLVEFDAGLLLASVLPEAAGDGGDGLSVSLHELHLEDGQDGVEEPEVEWVRRDESDLDIAKLRDHVMFLGFPGSFAIEAAEFGGEVSGGAAYFVIEDAEPCSVYSFHDGVAALVDRLPPGWSDARCMWLLPEQPQILAAFDPPEEDSIVPVGSSVDIQSCGNSGGPPPPQQLRIYAGGLSPKVDNSRLREMFSVYGKVARARVVYNQKGRSRGFGQSIQPADPIMPAATTMVTAGGGSQWSELPADLLRDISVRLHAAADFVRFRAVCRPWAESTLVDGPPPSFLPWQGAPVQLPPRLRRGTAYFVVDSSVRYGWSSCTRLLPAADPCHVYRYSFHDGTTELVETLPPEWNDRRCMWFLPADPQISPIRARRAPATSSGSSGGQESSLRIYAKDLARKVDNSRLLEMFGVHGKVASARVVYDKKGRSREFGFVTMATLEGYEYMTMPWLLSTP